MTHLWCNLPYRGSKSTIEGRTPAWDASRRGGRQLWMASHLRKWTTSGEGRTRYGCIASDTTRGKNALESR